MFPWNVTIVRVGVTVRSTWGEDRRERRRGVADAVEAEEAVGGTVHTNVSGHGGVGMRVPHGGRLIGQVGAAQPGSEVG